MQIEKQDAEIGVLSLAEKEGFEAFKNVDISAYSRRGV